MWNMMPLLPALVMLYSIDSSNQSYLSLVTMSLAFLGSAQTNMPSLICQPERTPSSRKLCQPSSDLPLKSNFQPAFFSGSVSWLGDAAFWATAAPGKWATKSAPIMIPRATAVGHRLDGKLMEGTSCGERVIRSSRSASRRGYADLSTALALALPFGRSGGGLGSSIALGAAECRFDVRSASAWPVAHDSATVKRFWKVGLAHPDSKWRIVL